MPTTRQQTIEKYGRAYEELLAALEEFPREMWQHRGPSDPWTIHEIIMHLTDSEANSYIRCRRLVAEPGSAVLAYDENRWAAALHYHEQSTEMALELFRWLRLSSYNLIRALPEETWANTINHSENGVMTMDDWLEVYVRHVSDHIAQMRAIHAAWAKAGR